MCVKSLPNPAWLFLANVVSHMDHDITILWFIQTNRGWSIWVNREKAGLSKTGVSCRRLHPTDSWYMCDMFTCHSWPENHKMRIAPRPIRFLVGVRYFTLSLLAIKVTRCASHIDRFDSWSVCDIFILSIFMLPKRRFWKAERTLQNAFSKHFSKNRIHYQVLTPLKVLWNALCVVR